MKVVLDTNVVVSGLMKRVGNCALVLDHIIEGHLIVCLDSRILDEYERVSMYPRLRLDALAVRDFLNFLRDCGEWVVARPMAIRLPDPDDLPFIEAAAESSALLVTGNRKHFPKKSVGRVQVVSPVQLLAMMRA